MPANLAGMNRLATDKRAAVIAALVEGTSINATCRIIGVAKHTVLKLLKRTWDACASHHDAHVIRRTREYFNADWDTDKRIQQKARKPRPHGGALLHALQLLPRA